MERGSMNVRQHAPPGTPRRFGVSPESSARAGRRLLMGATGGISEAIDPALQRRLAEGLRLGDPPADALVACMHREGQRRVWGWIEAAMRGGPQAVAEAPQELRDYFEGALQRPDWVRWDAVQEGARVSALGGRAAMNALLINGLMAGYQFSSLNRVLIATGQLEASASQRIAYTTRWWFDVSTPGGLEPMGAGFTSTLRVRLIHALVRDRLLRGGWDVDEEGIPVNQTDTQITYLGFSVVYLLGMKLVGVVLTPAERAALMHRWRYAAWLMGVREDYLHALEDEERAATSLLYQAVLGQRFSDETTPLLARPLLDSPADRAYRFAPTLSAAYHRRSLISLASLSVGHRALTEMGISERALPWYPIGMFLAKQLLHRAARLSPGGRGWLERWGRSRQAEVLAEVGGRGPELAHGVA